MGAQKSKFSIVILDDFKNPPYFRELTQDPDIKTIYYDSFDSFLEMENTKNISNILVRHKQLDIEQAMSSIDWYNPFIKVSPFLLNQEQTMKEKIIAYIRKYSLNINLYLVTDELTNTKIPEDDKPYIKMVFQGCSSIKQQIQNQKTKFGLNIRLKRLIEDLYRRVTVKIIDSRYKVYEGTDQSPQIIQQIALLQENNITYQYYHSIKAFQKSLIGTTTEYVICFPQTLSQLIDLRKMLDDSYSIILHTDSKNDLQEHKKKQLWSIDQKFFDIVCKIKRCSVNSELKLSQISENTIICGHDCVYEIYFDRIKEEIERRLVQKHGREKFDSLKISYLKGYQSYEEMFQLIYKSVYSYIVVFDRGQFLQDLKNMLKTKKLHRRVQVTCIPDCPQKFCHEQDIIDYKVGYLEQNINFKINFEVGPLRSVHLYRPDLETSTFFQQKMALDIVTIKEQKDMSDFLPPRYFKIIDSGHLITNIQNFEQSIKPMLQTYKDTYFGQLKIIILDSKKKIKLFVTSPQNFVHEIGFVHYNISKVADYLMFQKCCNVSLPRFKKYALSKFGEISKIISTVKASSQLSMNSSVISANQILRQIFSTGLKSNIQYTLQFMVFPFKQMNTEKYLHFYKEQYLSSYADLWYLGYNIFQKKDGQYINFQIIKEDLISCFNRIKNYELLRINDEDFKNFYVNNIKKCQSFIELQIACIYIISLPHGLSYILNQIFKRPRKTKIAVKIFRPLVVMIFLAFSSFIDYKLDKVQLVAHIQDDKFLEKLKIMEKGDLIYNSGFAFCCRNQEDIEKQDRHSIIFEFQNLSFLKNSRISNNLQIQKFSFYKESAEYIIPPHTPFFVKKILTKINGKKIVILKEIDDNREQSFLERVLRINHLTNQNIQPMLEQEIQANNQTHAQQEKLLITSDSSLSLFQKAEKMALLENWIKMVYNMQKGLAYSQFSSHLKNKNYISAQLSLEERINLVDEEISTDRSETQYLNIEKAFLAFKMGQYQKAIYFLKSLKRKLLLEDLVPEEEWIIKKLNQFIVSTEMTLNYRQKFLHSHRKTKKWIISPQCQEGNINYKVKPVNPKWTTVFSLNQQKFAITKIKDNNIGQLLTISEPSNEFGTIPFAFSINELHSQLQQQQKQANKITQLFKNSSIEKNNIINPLEKAFFKNQQSQSSTLNVPNSHINPGLRNKQNQCSFLPMNSNKMLGIRGYQNIGTSKSIAQHNKMAQVKEQKKNLYQLQEQIGIQNMGKWKVFMYEDRVVLSECRKHFHGKLKKLKGMDRNIKQEVELKIKNIR